MDFPDGLKVGKTEYFEVDGFGKLTDKGKKDFNGPTKWPTCIVCGKELELLGPGITNGFEECCDLDELLANEGDGPF